MNVSAHQNFVSRHHSLGLAAVEFAIVVPVVLFLLLACAELGRAMYQYNTLTKAVRNGAIYAGQVALDPGTHTMALTAGKQASAQNVTVFGTPTAGGSAVLPNFAPGSVTVVAIGTTQVQVSAAYSYVPLFLGGIPTFGQGQSNSIASPVTLSASCRARAL